MAEVPPRRNLKASQEQQLEQANSAPPPLELVVVTRPLEIGQQSQERISTTPESPKTVDPFIEREHRWKKMHFSRFTYCNVCRQLLFGLGKQGYSCEICGTCVHFRCSQATIAKSCRPTITSNEHPNQHHWVEGNMHMLPARIGSLCSECGRQTGSLTTLTDFRCSWCNVAVHGSCRERFPSECTLGDLSRLIVPPNSIIPSGTPDRFIIKLPQTMNTNNTTMIKEPLIVFVNTKSGGQQGKYVLSAMRKSLNPRQVFDLISCNGPELGIDFLSSLQSQQLKILVCGGDGTVNWILEALRKRDLHPPVCILPLGTGNDLARAYGWGGGYDGEDIDEMLKSVMKADYVPLDRWLLKTEILDPNAGGIRTGAPIEKIFNNYFSIGIDASVALDFHRKRESNPEAFNSRVGNKIIYVQLATHELFNPNNNLWSNIQLEVDGLQIRLPQVQTIVVLNLPSCYGGRNLWGTSLSELEVDRGFVPISSNDRILEIVAIKNVMELGQVNSRMALPEKIAQGKSIRITFLNGVSFPCQVDGEPYIQQPAVIEISLLERALILVKS